jgi:exosortase/archaeosortase family protein
LGTSNHIIYESAELLGIKDGYWISFHWPLAIEYLVFSFFFTMMILIIYKRKAIFSIFALPLAILWGMGAMYLIDVLYPYGKLKFFQILSLPTSAWAVSILELFGHNVILRYEANYGLPIIMILERSPTGSFPSAAVGWPCSGVHSLFLYMLIIIPLLKQYHTNSSKKLAYFLLGALLTYTVNVFRIVLYFLIYLYYGNESARVFHDTYGELFFLMFILTFIITIHLIESGKEDILMSLRKTLENREIDVFYNNHRNFE